MSNIPALYICLCEVTHVGQDKGAKPGWTRGDSTCERSTIPGWLEISTPPGSRFKSRTFLVVAKEVCGLFASLIILIGCVHWEREKLNIFLPGVVLGEVEIGACSLQRWVYQIIPSPVFSWLRKGHQELFTVIWIKQRLKWNVIRQFPANSSLKKKKKKNTENDQNQVWSEALGGSETASGERRPHVPPAHRLILVTLFL